MTKTTNDRKVYIISTALATVPSSTARASQKSQKSSDRRPAALLPVRESVAEIGFDSFAANIESATSALSDIFETAFDKTFGDFQLDEVEVELEISADGKVGFLGSSVGIKGSSSLKLTFKRKKVPD